MKDVGASEMLVLGPAGESYGSVATEPRMGLTKLRLSPLPGSGLDPEVIPLRPCRHGRQCLGLTSATLQAEPQEAPKRNLVWVPMLGNGEIDWRTFGIMVMDCMPGVSNISKEFLGKRYRLM